MSTVTQNITRLTHLMNLYRLSSGELLDILSDGLIRRVSESEIFSNEIKLSNLKKIDKIFNKGLSYYVDPSPVQPSKSESIFFRKNSFNASLKLSDIQFVNKFEEKKINFESLLKLSDISKRRILPKYTIDDSPKVAAIEVRNHIYPKGSRIPRTKDFLKELISNLADKNVLVFEYVEHPSKKDKVNVNGFYLSPDVIVLKWQKYAKREVFTLAHEIGHYLLEEEEIDENIEENPAVGLSAVENWCNDFAFRFLIGDYNIDNLPFANPENDFHHALVSEISGNTHLSTLSIYTRLLLSGKLSKKSYNSILQDIEDFMQKRYEEERAELENKRLKAELKGEKLVVAPVKAIVSPFYLQTLKIAFFNGILNEYEFCKTLNIKPDKLDAYLA